MVEDEPRESMDSSTRLGHVLLVFAVVTFCMFGDLLFASGHPVLSLWGKDTATQFLPFRKFAVDEILHGRLPLWCPSIYGGEPFVANFLSAVFYPPNVLFLVLPLDLATNVEIVGHVFLAGVFMWMWLRRCEYSQLSSITVGMLYMFCGPFFTNVYSGHQPNLYSLALFPLLLFAVEDCCRGRGRRGVMVGAFVLAMQMFAGHPQYPFYSGIAMAIYGAVRLPGVASPVRVTLMLAAMSAFSILLCAVQLLPGLDAASESLRSARMSYGLSTEMSLPLENLLTAAAGGVFGDGVQVPYCGRNEFWEACLFVGVVACGLALYGLLVARTAQGLRAAICAGVLMLLALGSTTPIFTILQHLPGFDRLRGPTKFMPFAMVFWLQLAAIGLDHLWRNRAASARFTVFSGLATVACAGAALLLAYLPPGALLGHVPTRVLLDAPTHAHALLCLWQSAAIMLVFTLILARLQARPSLIYVLAVLGVLEVFIFARAIRVTFDYQTDFLGCCGQFQAMTAGQAKDERLLEFQESPNYTLFTGEQNLWGYDPNPPLRWYEFMVWTQGQDADVFRGSYLAFKGVHPLYPMLRLRTVLYRDGPAVGRIVVDHPLPHLLLVDEFEVAHGRDDVFRHLSAADFDPRRRVILESMPALSASARGDSLRAGSNAIRVVREVPGSLELEVDTDRDRMLLITDAYSKGWLATALPGSSQDTYRLQPANYVLRAIALRQGHHHILVAYQPSAFTWGLVISSIAWLGFALLLVLRVGQRQTRGYQQQNQNHATPSVRFPG